MTNKIPTKDITGLVLAGGRGMRMGQVNKGLQLLNAEPMVAHVLRRLGPQVSQVIINVNQDLEHYAQFSCPLVSDVIPNYAGPLAGIHAGLSICTTPYVAITPCDSPFLPLNLVEQLADALTREHAQIALAITKETQGNTAEWQQQPVFCLMRVDLQSHLEAFLKSGGRKVSDWYADLKITEVAFQDASDFRNINTRAELAEHTYEH
jgi:molybdopterin-guanine dinucleotide biosynthesis protein A